MHEPCSGRLQTEDPRRPHSPPPCGIRSREGDGGEILRKDMVESRAGESIVHIDNDAVRRAVEIDAGLALTGARPHVIDEWQNVPKIWDAVRRAVDESGNRRGQYILTGSSSADKAKVSHSGAGRIAKIHMRPLSLFESGMSDGTVSLAGLFDRECPTAPSSTSALDLARAICLGGWPASLGAHAGAAPALPGQYMEALFEASAHRAGLDPTLAERVDVSLERNPGRTLTYKAIHADVFQEEPGGGTMQTQPPSARPSNRTCPSSGTSTSWRNGMAGTPR